MPVGAGPGAALPNSRASEDHARFASSPVTFCSSTAATADSQTLCPVGTRQVRPRLRHWSAIGPGPGSKESAAVSRAPTTSAARGASHSAPGPQQVLATTGPDTVSRWVTGPAGVLAVRQTPSAANWSVGSLRPRCMGPRIDRRSG